MPLLRQGSRGDAVRTLQTEINEVFPRRLAVDGIFGPLTLGAVRDFQRQRRLAVDGVVGPLTWRALGR